MTSPGYILSIDLGSSSVKVAVVDANGNIVGAGIRTVETLQPSPGASEQDPHTIWRAICDACAAAIAGFAQPASEIIGVTCTSQYFSLVPVDSAGAALGNVIMWSDERGGPYTTALHGDQPQAIGKWLDTTGFLPIPSGNDSLSHALYLKNEVPALYNRAAKLLEPADFVIGLLTGRCVTNACSGFAQLLIDNRNLDTAAYDSELITMSGLDPAKMPELVDRGSCVGTLTSAAATQLGLDPSTQVFAGINDTQAVSVGTVSHVPGRAGINIGTTCQVLAFVDSLRTDPANNLFAMPSALPHLYNLMAENGLGGRLLEHFLTNLAFPRDALSDSVPDNVYSGIDRVLETEPPGSGGVLYLPWLNGSNTPTANAAMRGGFLNISLDTTRAMMLRAVIEGVTFNLCWQLGHAETLVGRSIDELRFAGGGAQWDQWAQTVADITNRPVEQMDSPRHTNNRATAFLAFERMGILSIDDADRFFPVRHRYLPRPEHRSMYEHLFGNFQQAFEQTRPIFEALNRDSMILARKE